MLVTSQKHLQYFTWCFKLFVWILFLVSCCCQMKLVTGERFCLPSTWLKSCRLVFSAWQFLFTCMSKGQLLSTFYNICKGFKILLNLLFWICRTLKYSLNTFSIAILSGCHLTYSVCKLSTQFWAVLYWRMTIIIGLTEIVGKKSNKGGLNSRCSLH